MALHLTTVDGEPVTVEVPDLAAIRYGQDETQIFLHNGKSLMVREGDDELYGLILAEQGQGPATEANQTS